MKRSRMVALVVSFLAVSAVTAPPAQAARATGWTNIQSSYATDALTPRFQWCEVSERNARVTLKVRAIRPRPAVVSQAITWNDQRDFSGSSNGSADSNSWNGDTSVMRITLPKSSYLVISYQTRTEGSGFTAARRPPLGLDRCP